MREIIAKSNIHNLTMLTQVQYGWITQIAWSPVENTLGIAGSEGFRLYVNSFGGRATFDVTGHDGHVKAIAFSADGGYFATTSADTTVKVWKLAPQLEEIYVFKGHKDSVDSVAFSPDGKYLVSGSSDHTMRLWNLENGTLKAVFEGHQAEVSSVAFALQGNVIVSGSRDNTIRIWDISGETGGTIQGTHQSWVRNITVKQPGTMIVSASKDGTIRLWDIYSEAPYAIVHAHQDGADTADILSMSSLLVTGGRDAKTRIWDIHQIMRLGECDESSALLALDVHDKPVLSVAFNATGHLLATASGDNTVKLWGIP